MATKAVKTVKAVKVAQKPPTAKQKLDAIGIDALCKRVSDCQTLQQIADSVKVTKWDLLRYLNSETHHDAHMRAREAQADKLVDDILKIADDGSNDTYETDNGTATNHDVIARSRLRVDARKWLAAKMSPKKYGDKLAVGGADDMPAIAQSITVNFK